MLNNSDALQQKAVVEIRLTVGRTGRPKLVPYTDRFSHTGFTSVYGYLEEAVSSIASTRGTRGLSKFPVFSDMLFVDFDNNDEAANEFAELLAERDVKYEMFHSGGRSVHFHVPIHPMYGINVPGSQKAWMEEHAPQADMSIYRHSGLYRLPGTYHVKHPGKKKERIGGNSSAAEILRIENRPKVSLPIDEEEGDPRYFHAILGKLLHMRISEGGRHQHAFKVVMACKSSNKDGEYARKLVGMWNTDNCHPPKSEWELDKLVGWVYDR